MAWKALSPLQCGTAAAGSAGEDIVPTHRLRRLLKNSLTLMVGRRYHDLRRGRASAYTVSQGRQPPHDECRGRPLMSSSEVRPEGNAAAFFQQAAPADALPRNELDPIICD